MKKISKMTQLVCKHYFDFLPEKMNGLLERKIYGLCRKCGKSKLFTVEQYKAINKKQKDSEKDV